MFVTRFDDELDPISIQNHLTLLLREDEGDTLAKLVAKAKSIDKSKPKSSTRKAKLKARRKTAEGANAAMQDHVAAASDSTLAAINEQLKLLILADERSCARAEELATQLTECTAELKTLKTTVESKSYQDVQRTPGPRFTPSPGGKGGGSWKGGQGSAPPAARG